MNISRPPPYQTRCNTVGTWKSKRRSDCFPKVVNTHAHTHTRIHGSEAVGKRLRPNGTAALPKESQFKGFRNFWQGAAFRRKFSPVGALLGFAREPAGRDAEDNSDLVPYTAQTWYSRAVCRNLGWTRACCSKLGELAAVPKLSTSRTGSACGTQAACSGNFLAPMQWHALGKEMKGKVIEKSSLKAGFPGKTEGLKLPGSSARGEEQLAQPGAALLGVVVLFPTFIPHDSSQGGGWGWGCPLGFMGGCRGAQPLSLPADSHG